MATTTKWYETSTIATTRRALIVEAAGFAFTYFTCTVSWPLICIATIVPSSTTEVTLTLVIAMTARTIHRLTTRAITIAVGKSALPDASPRGAHIVKATCFAPVNFICTEPVARVLADAWGT